MRRVFLLSLAVLLICVPAASAESRIPAGVSAAGIDVSNLTLPEASNRIAYVYTQKLGSPLSTHVADLRFVLRPKDVDFKFDAAKSARRAYNAGVAPHIGPVNVPLYVEYSNAKVQAYAGKIAKRLTRPAVDARVNITLRHIGKVASRDGRAIDAAALAKTVTATLSDPAAERKLRPKLVAIKPKVTTAGLASAY